MTKSLPLALLITAGLLSSTAPASAYITYGNTVVNGTTYNLSPYANLFEANLTGANLTGADLNHIQLPSATLIGTNLTGADLSDANLYYADLSDAILTGAYLSWANLTNANLTGASVSYSNWTDFRDNSGAVGLSSYLYDSSLINYAHASVPEPSTYGLIGIGALGVAFAARRRKIKAAQI